MNPERLKAISRRIFLAKCADMEIPPSAAREQRFLATVLKSCSGFRLDLSNKELGQNAIAEIARTLKGDEHYVALSIAGNVARDAGASLLAEVIGSNSTLTECDLRSNDIGIKGACDLFRALELSATITSVDLSGMSGINRNHIGVKGAQAVATMLQRNQVIWKLCLQENGLGIEGVEALAVGLSTNISLGFLDLASNALGLAGVQVLSDVLPESRLTTLILSRNFIGDPGVAALGEALRKVNCITHLDLSDDDLGPKSGKYLADAMRSPTCILQSLVISDNALGEAGIRYLADALRDTRGLTELVAARNRITAKSIPDFSNGLKYNRSLRKLDLSGNKIGDEGAASLVEPLCLGSCGITHLFLGSSFVGDAGGAALAKVIQQNEKLVFLDLRNNFLMESAAEAVLKVRIPPSLLSPSFKSPR